MTGRASKSKGYRCERDIVKWLRVNGYPKADRRIAGAALDKGDVINGPDGVLIQAKDEATWRPGSDMDAAKAQAVNAGVSLPVVVRKRRGTSDVGEWFAVLRVSDFVELLRKASDA